METRTHDFLIEELDQSRQTVVVDDKNRVNHLLSAGKLHREAQTKVTRVQKAKS